MRSLWISLLTVSVSLPALAQGAPQDWKYRARNGHAAPDIRFESRPGHHEQDARNDGRFRRDWEAPRFHHRTFFREAPVFAHPGPMEGRFEPLPPHPRIVVPPPSGIHIWFGF
jgi:hypothetical protein